MYLYILWYPFTTPHIPLHPTKCYTLLQIVVAFIVRNGPPITRPHHTLSWIPRCARPAGVDEPCNRLQPLLDF